MKFFSKPWELQCHSHFTWSSYEDFACDTFCIILIPYEIHVKVSRNSSHAVHIEINWVLKQQSMIRIERISRINNVMEYVRVNFLVNYQTLS